MWRYTSWRRIKAVEGQLHLFVISALEGSGQLHPTAALSPRNNPGTLWIRPGSSVGIATELRFGRSGIESRWGRDFPPVQTGPGAHPTSCSMGTGSFPGVKCGWGVLLTTHTLLVPRSWKTGDTVTLWIRNRMGPRFGLYGFEKSKIFLSPRWDSKSRNVQPVA